MVQLTTSAVLLTTVLGASLVAAQSSMSEEAWKTKLDKHNKDAECDNGCFFPEFTNKCNSDNPACTCTLKPERERYWCCLARKCDSNVLPDAMARQLPNCVAWNKPIPTEFDTQAVCGIKLATSSSSSMPASSAVASSTKAPESLATAAGTPAGSAAKTGSETPAATSTPPSNGASSGRGIWSGAAIALAAFGILM